MNIDETPFKWWSAYKKEFQILSLIVRRLLSTPPNSIHSEHLVSSEDFIYDPTYF